MSMQLSFRRRSLASSTTASSFNPVMIVMHNRSPGPVDIANSNDLRHARCFPLLTRLMTIGRPRLITAALFYTVVTWALAAAVTAASAESARETETVKMVFQHAIPNTPGKKLIALVVNYPPGGKSLPHHHAKSAFVFAYVLSGAIRSGVDAQPAKIHEVGESFYEEPGAHHRVSENASETKPASLLAVFVVDAENLPLTIFDSNSDY